MRRVKFSNPYWLGLKYPLMILAVSLGLTLVSLYYAQKLKIETDFSALLPKDQPSVQNFQVLKKYFGSIGYLFITVESDDPQLNERFADQFVAQVEKLPLVRYVEYRRPVDYFQERKWFFIDLEDLRKMERRVDRALELEKKGISPVFSGLMDFADEADNPDLTFKDIRKKYESRLNTETASVEQAEEGRLLIVRVKSFKGSEDFAANRELVSGVQAIEKKISSQPEFKAIKVGYGGNYKNTLETIALVQREMALESLIVAALLMIILVAYFKRFSGAVLVGVPLLMAVAWTAGLTYLMLGRVNILTAFGVSILAGLGSDYGIYLLARFLKEIDHDNDFNGAAQQAYAVTGKATLMAVLTTMAAFAALLLSGFAVFVEFGLIGFIGLFLNYIAMILVQPALLAIGKRYPDNSWLKHLVGWKRRGDWAKWESSAWIQKIFAPTYPKAVLLGTLALIALCIPTLPHIAKIYFEDGQMEYKQLPSSQLNLRIAKALHSSLQPTAVLVSGEANERKIVKTFHDALERKDGWSPVYDRIFGISSFIPDDQAEKAAILKRLAEKYPKNHFINPRQKEEFLKSVAETLKSGFITAENLPKEIRRMFLSDTDPKMHAVFIFPSIDRQNNFAKRRYTSQIMGLQQDSGVSATPVDSVFIHTDILDLIEFEAPRGFFFVMAALFLILLISLRNLKRILLIFANLLASLIILSGIMYLTGIKLNILNICVFPIILGTGIDCFIHFSHHFDESGSLSDTIQHDIPPILVSNLTSIVGFGGLIFTSGLGLQRIGWVASIGLLLTTIFCVWIFPRILAIPAFASASFFSWRSAKRAEAN